jgi:hypothetical protein
MLPFTDSVVAAGYYLNTTLKSVKACSADTYSAIDRPLIQATDCTACEAGWSTASLEAQINCSEWGS